MEVELFEPKKITIYFCFPLGILLLDLQLPILPDDNLFNN